MDWSWVHSCAFCQKMQIQVPKHFEPDGDQSISLDLTFDDIVHGAENGCTFYATLKSPMERYPEALDRSAPIEVSLCYGPGDSLDVWFKRIVRPFFAFTQEGDPVHSVVNRVLPNLEPGSAPSLSKASSWLSNCLTNHPKCSSKGTCESPARLLKLGQDESTVCLVPNHQHYRYAALSYCWGGDQEYKLTRARLAAYQASIRVASLPKSVQDAIQVAQSIEGISYIWIDSLCIIQDDDDDKGSQLAKMGDIYRGAMVTISAASAGSCYEGFLKSRECPEKAKPIAKIPFISGTWGKGEVYLVPHAGREADPDPINYRAWTLQEHVLSPRILYYSSLQPHWLCRSERKSDGGMRFPQVLESRRYGDEMGLFAFSGDGAHRTWVELLATYTRRNMTNPGDRYVAIEAIGQDVAKAMGTDYVAGLFANTWAIDLSWMAEQPQPCPSQRAGPSWSWTSISGAINMVERERDTKDTIEVVSFDVKWKIPGARSGEIQSASLKVRAWMKPQKLHFGPARRRAQFADCTGAHIAYYPDTIDSSYEDGKVVDLWLMEVSQLFQGHHFNCEIWGLVLCREGSGAFKRVAGYVLRLPSLSKLAGVDEASAKDLIEGPDLYDRLGFTQMEVHLV
ncbi:HET domain-containing protein [Fusarium sp. Ph1]|nr:HET domain-containing protein [Fusarium sp. Ph1]